MKSVHLGYESTKPGCISLRLCLTTVLPALKRINFWMQLSAPKSIGTGAAENISSLDLNVDCSYKYIIFLQSQELLHTRVKTILFTYLYAYLSAKIFIRVALGGNGLPRRPRVSSLWKSFEEVRSFRVWSWNVFRTSIGQPL